MVTPEPCRKSQEHRQDVDQTGREGLRQETGNYHPMDFLPVEDSSLLIAYWVELCPSPFIC